ncbi:MAG: hypothetical protein Kow0090_17650 [Myxococcota bacterium]
MFVLGDSELARILHISFSVTEMSSEEKIFGFDCDLERGLAREISADEAGRASSFDDGAPVKFMGMVTSHPAMKALFPKIITAAKSGLTVLIEGETGSGKELVARALHDLSPFASGPFIPVNCGAIPESLAESELFGHEKGAFSGATQTVLGAFEAADKGTLFLDEISELSLTLQAKLLRVLEDGEVKRVGASHPRKIKTRIIAATNRNLQELCKNDKFREDLLFRIYVLYLLLPPLRERRGDILPLVRHFIGELVQDAERYRVDDSAIRKLERHLWHGNIRELRNVVQRAILNCAARTITADDIILEERKSYRGRSVITLGGVPLARVEEEVVRYELDRNSGNRAQTSKALGISLPTLRAKMEKYGLLYKSDGRNKKTTESGGS